MPWNEMKMVTKRVPREAMNCLFGIRMKLSEVFVMQKQHSKTFEIRGFTPGLSYHGNKLLLIV